MSNNTTSAGKVRGKKCTHPLPPHIMTIGASAAGCETTVYACPCCGKYLTEPKTDC